MEERSPSPAAAAAAAGTAGAAAAGGGGGVGGDAEEGLGFVTPMYMGEDHLGLVRVRPQPPRSLSPSPSPWQPRQSPPVTGDQPRPPPRQSCDNEEDEGNAEHGRDAQAVFGSEIRLLALSSASERCLPLAVLQSVAAEGVWFKLEPSEGSSSSEGLSRMFSACVRESKTAVVILDGGATEVHLVAVKSCAAEEDSSCTFWAFAVPRGLYHSTLTMLNMRCLAMVFDLDETLILANTMRSFEDRIEFLKIQIEKQRIPIPNKGMDVQKLAVLTTELKRFLDDRALLKHYADNDSVVDNGRLIRAQLEEVAPNVFRPVVRIPERNLILTRINPAVRDTSVLVRLRPAWEELRTYLIARGRKRFEVFICTMSERDYALEMWRLLDPGARLIEAKELPRRLLCVKADSRKSLSNMFEQLQCHPKLAMVIDDRTEVWEDKDKAQIHAVPAFAPYSAPQAETNVPLPVLCIARNVACNVRGAFFKDFDELFHEKFSQVTFDTDVSSLPVTPHVGNYLSEASSSEIWLPESVTTGPPDGIAGSEVKSALYPVREEKLLSESPPQELPSAGGWLEAEDEDQAQPESPSATPLPTVSGSGSTAANGSAEHTNGLGKPEMINGDKPSEKDAQRYVDEARKLMHMTDFIAALEELGTRFKCSVEYQCAIRPDGVLQFAAEAFFEKKKVGQGVGKTNKEAKSRAAEDAMRCLADLPAENPVTASKKDVKPSFNAVAALDLCTMNVVYLERPSSKGGFECEVEVGGQILAKGSGRDLESAKQEAAKQALKKLGTGSNKPQKRSSPPRISVARQESNKRVKSGTEGWRAAGRNRVKTPPRKQQQQQQQPRNRR